MSSFIGFFENIPTILKQLNSDYGYFLEISLLVISTIISIFLGKKVILWFFETLLDQRDGAIDEKETIRIENQTLKNDLVKIDGELKSCEAKLQRARDGFANPMNDLWLRSPFDFPENYHNKVRNSIPIMMVANLKGGVGKTTVATCLSSYFDMECGERILAIDLDYQGSMSSMLLHDPRERDAQPAIDLLEASNDVNAILGVTSQIRETDYDSRIIQCQHNFANFETRLTLKWLIDDITEDIRYNLAKVLFSEEIQNNFDRIIIDAPPRVTPGFINALCSSTDLLIPTMLDHLSVDAVDTFLADIRRMKGNLFPELNITAIIGTMKATGGELRQSEEAAVERLKELSERELGSSEYFLDQALITRIEAISSSSGVRDPYRSSPKVRQVFNPLGEELIERTDRRQRNRNENQAIHTYTAALH